MLRPDLASLFCPRNDLESDTIRNIAQGLGLDVREVSGDWGLTLEDALRQHPNLGLLREHVVVVELPGTAGVGLLKAEGRRVHIIDHHGRDSQDRPSALEQFARLFGYRLSAAEYEVAIADRDFYPGLSQAGVPFARAVELREQEFAVRNNRPLVEEARRFVQDPDHDRRIGRLRLLLAPERLANVLLEVAQTPSPEDYTSAQQRRQPVPLKEVLAIFHAQDDRAAIRALRFGGGAVQRQALASLLDDSDLSDGLELWSGGGRFGGFFGARARPGHPAPAFDRLVSRIFALIGGTDRPLLHYGCTFLLPLDLHRDSELSKDAAMRLESLGTCLKHKCESGEILSHRLSVVPPRELPRHADRERRHETQAYLYFLPLLRNLLYDTEPSERSPTQGERQDAPCPIQRWRLAPQALQDLRWRLEGFPDGAPALEAAIRDVSLYRYYNELYLLAIQVEPADALMRIEGAEGLARDGDIWWHPLFFTDTQTFERIEQLRLDHWLRFTKHARILYPSFIEQVQEHKFETQALLAKGRTIARFDGGDDVSPILHQLLSRFLLGGHNTSDQIKELLRLQHLPEERMHVNVVYGLAGPPPADAAERAEADRLFSLALYVDRQADTWSAADGYAYDPGYTRSLAEGHRLDRWRALGTYLGYCPYANAYLGFGGFFSNIMATEHVPYHYERMLILALFYQLTLRNYNRRITHATRDLLADRRADPGLGFRELRGDFIEFTNRYRFREVTLAIQGKEIFARQIAALDIEAEYGEVKDEMERADEYVQSLQGRRLDERMSMAGLIALIIAGVSLLLPMLEYGSTWQRLGWVAMILVSALLILRVYRGSGSADSAQDRESERIAKPRPPRKRGRS